MLGHQFVLCDISIKCVFWTQVQPFALLVQTECNLDRGMLPATGHLRTLKIAYELTEATPLYELSTNSLRQGDGSQVVVLEQALGAFPAAQNVLPDNKPTMWTNLLWRWQQEPSSCIQNDHSLRLILSPRHLYAFSTKLLYLNELMSLQGKL